MQMGSVRFEQKPNTRGYLLSQLLILVASDMSRRASGRTELGGSFKAAYNVTTRMRASHRRDAMTA